MAVIRGRTAKKYCPPLATIPSGLPQPREKMDQKLSDNIVCLDKGKLVKSKAWLSLRGIAPQVYILFLCRRKIGKIGKTGHKRKVCTNYLDLRFTYIEAEKKYNITATRFRRAIDNLIKNGFLDIVKQGGQLYHQEAVYGLSDRWEKFGTNEFEHKERPKGFKIGYRGARKEK